MASLHIHNVTKQFGSVGILRDINLSIEDGDFLVLVGPSGCGKSTLLNIIAGLEPLSGGTISIDGRSVQHLEPKARDIAMVFQSYALYPSMTVEKNIAFPLRMRGHTPAEQAAKVRQVAELLQIGHLLDRKPQQLSGGQRQRVAMGRALVRDPKIFLFDEPLSNLDAKLRVDMRTEIKRLHQRVRKTTVYVTHDQVEAMTMATRIAVMKDGIVQQFGTPDDIYSRPATRFVAEFIGSPAMNMVEGSISGDHVQAHGVALPVNEAQRAALGQNGAAITYGLRPEALSFSDAGLPGQISMLEPTGPETYVSVDTAAGLLVVRAPGKVTHGVGSTVHLHWSTADVHLFDGQNQRRVGP